MRINRWQKSLGFLASALISLLVIIGWQNYATAQKNPLTLETALLSLEQVGDGIYALISDTDYPPESENIAICNAGIIIGDDGVVVIDLFQNEALGNLLLSETKKLTDLPVKYVVNTHFHFDHTGGNKAIKSQEIPLIGRGTIREAMLTKNLEYEPSPTPPEIIVFDDSKIWLGERVIELEVVEGHSGGTDIIAYIPDAKVLFAGDILFNQKFPYIADGNLKTWQQTLADLSEKYSDATFVPGHGKVTDKSSLLALKNYLDELESMALKWQQLGLSEAAAIESAETIPADYQDYRFKALYPSNLQTAYQQITQQ
ncbi:MAG TPA: MBL fold metallo-hydrolase [Xenococcaceae cyanobacterium]